MGWAGKWAVQKKGALLSKEKATDHLGTGIVDTYATTYGTINCW